MYTEPIDRSDPPAEDPPPGPSLLDRAVVTQEELSWELLVQAARERGRDPRLVALSDEQLREQLATGASAIAAAMCRWLELLAEFVVRGTWADEGARTPGVWLSWAVGVGPSTAREQVRVALRLRDLPRVRERFAQGRLSYSKVRAITRIGLDVDEELLLMWADHGTAADLERIAGGVRSSARTRKDARTVGDDPDYGWRTRSHGDGTVTLSLRGPAHEIAELEHHAERLAQAAVADRLGTDPSSGGEVVDGEVVDGEVVDRAGAGDDLGVPVPGRRVTAGDKLEALVRVVAAAADADLPPDSSGLDRHTLVLYADAAALADTDEGDEAGVEVEVAVPAAPDIVPVRDASGRVRGMERRVLRRLACDAGVVVVVTGGDGSPLDVGRRRRRTTAALRRAVQLRDRCCTFPGCLATRNLHVHHVQHWADDGPTDRGNLVLVCGFHHRFVHDRGWTIEVGADGRHRCRPPGAAGPVATVSRLPGASAEAVAASCGSGSASAEALLPAGYTGDRFDLDTAVAVLQQAYERAHPDLTQVA